MKTLISSMILAGVITANAYAFDIKTNTVTVVIPFAPGGGVDQTFRHLQKYALDKGINLVAIYKPGADGTIAMSELYKMPKDGFHITVTTAGVLAVHSLRKPGEELTAITGIRDSIGAFVTHPNSPIKTIDDLERAVQRGDDIKFGYGAPGQQMVLDQFFEFAKPKSAPLMVPYKGGGPVVNDLLGGHIDIAQVPLSIVKSHIDSGNLRLLALTRGRPVEYSSVPMIETKYPKWKEFDGFAVAAPKGSDPEAVKFWNTFLQNYMKDQQVQKDFTVDLTVASPFGIAPLEEIVQSSKKRLAKMEK